MIGWVRGQLVNFNENCVSNRDLGVYYLIFL